MWSLSHPRKFDPQNTLQDLLRTKGFYLSLELCMFHLQPFCMLNHQLLKGYQTMQV